MVNFIMVLINIRVTHMHEINKVKRSQKITAELLASFALEGIQPAQETLQDLALIDNGDMTPEEFIQYVKEKHSENE